jgi:GTP pyrophosphokinase
MTFLTARFDEAFNFARKRYNDQVRKGTDIPYLAHLMSTAALVLEAGGDEDQAIASLLHDTLEDRQHTKVTYEELLKQFGERVANIVRDCSDSEPEPGAEKEAWRPRKECYIADLRNHSPDSLLVSNADKLHNARAILADYRIHGEKLWSRFDPDSDQLWYYRSLVGVFREVDSPLAAELDRVVTELEGLVPRQP